MKYSETLFYNASFINLSYVIWNHVHNNIVMDFVEMQFNDSVSPFYPC